MLEMNDYKILYTTLMYQNKKSILTNCVSRGSPCAKFKFVRLFLSKLKVKIDTSWLELKRRGVKSKVGNQGCFKTEKKLLI